MPTSRMQRVDFFGFDRVLARWGKTRQLRRGVSFLLLLEVRLLRVLIAIELVSFDVLVLASVVVMGLVEPDRMCGW
ncbi:hypothetical protein RP20_CCG022516 [Aedes albopictus]|nr:hypothetical protein RP20_CCG000719 [Aedes albopictus]KXJ70779.1 hypothetical protein RP20_CCG022516 [Aedes albopictus]